MLHAGPTRRTKARQGLGLLPTEAAVRSGQAAAQRRGGGSAGSRRAPSLAEGCFELVRLQPASVAEVFMAGIRMSFALAAPRCLSFSVPLPPSSLSQLTSPQDPRDLLKFGPSRRRRAIPARSPGSG